MDNLNIERNELLTFLHQHTQTDAIFYQRHMYNRVTNMSIELTKMIAQFAKDFDVPGDQFNLLEADFSNYTTDFKAAVFAAIFDAFQAGYNKGQNTAYELVKNIDNVTNNQI